MITTMNIKVKFNRPIDDEKDYIVAGGFNFSVYGKDVEFDFEEQEYYIDSKEPCCAVFILRKPLLSEYPEFRRLSLKNIDRISEIKECFVYTGETGESDIEVMSIESISFVETEPKHLYIYRFLKSLLRSLIQSTVKLSMHCIFHLGQMEILLLGVK